MCSILKSIFGTAVVYSYLPDVPLKIRFFSSDRSVKSVRASPT